MCVCAIWVLWKAASSTVALNELMHNLPGIVWQYTDIPKTLLLFIHTEIFCQFWRSFFFYMLYFIAYLRYFIKISVQQVLVLYFPIQKYRMWTLTRSLYVEMDGFVMFGLTINPSAHLPYDTNLFLSYSVLPWWHFQAVIVMCF